MNAVENPVARILLVEDEDSISQPFTRSLSAVSIPAGVRQVKVRAHDSVHGYSAREVLVDIPG